MAITKILSKKVQQIIYKLNMQSILSKGAVATKRNFFLLTENLQQNQIQNQQSFGATFWEF